MFLLHWGPSRRWDGENWVWGEGAPFGVMFVAEVGAWLLQENRGH